MKKKIIATVLLSGALAVAATGGVSAYLTDFDKKTNEFTVGKVDIQVDEPKWNPEDQKTIEPGKEIQKDPQVTNTGANDAYVYMEVSIPIAKVEAANDDGTRLGVKDQELFSFTAAQDWSQLDTFKKDNSQVYVFAYNQILQPKQTTKPLFESMRFLNVIEGQLDSQTLSVPVRAYAIQTSYTGGEGKTHLEKAAAAYQKYINQNKEQNGQATQE